jgi:hypothetical protein
MDTYSIVNVRLANSEEVFQFSLSKLESRCQDVFKKITEKGKGHSFYFSAEGTFQAPGKSELPFVVQALRLFEEWVETGILRPIIKHISYNSIVYIFLHLIALRCGCETLGKRLIFLRQINTRRISASEILLSF